MSKPKLQHVPTVADLAAEGLAVLVDTSMEGRKSSVWRIRKKGYAKIHAAETHNAAILKPLVDAVNEAQLELDRRRAKLAKAESRRP